ncbi:DUF3397 domain-containing protein [Paenisporosarcina cavernae]|uniref:DUF3397 domain-containing protein n=1 Tax=Paenisporosarcina cavernae TaxID=2320858 RepID=A0A385YUK4_9BACL|nr:DUF3397 domain-containing protein [Paenisporosarcina cavernae]AYC29153.1 DUF3397 domain-containing protein [Paenisporosarcina cavernae]
MTSILSALSIFVAFPFLLFVIVYFLAKKAKKSSIRAFGIASDSTTILLMIAVPVTYQSLFHHSILAWVIVFICITAIVLTTIEWKTKKEIDIQSLFRRIARVLFLVFSVSLIMMWVVGIIRTILYYQS